METEECQKCGENFPLDLLMKGTRFGMTVPVCKGCTDWPRPWLDGDKVSKDFTAAIKNIDESRKKDGRK
mgnify:CR=1 FL=1